MRRVMFMALCAIFFAAACDDPMKMLPGHQIGEARIIAMKVTEPELTLESRPTARLLIGGEGFDQASDLSVLWLVPNDEETLSQIPAEVLEQLKAPYTADFAFPAGMTVGTLLSQSPDLQAQYDEQGWIDLPMLASVVIGEKPLSIIKRVRVTKGTPSHFNPDIIRIKAVYKEGGTLKTVFVDRDGTLELPQDAIPEYIGLDPEMADPALNGNDLLVYRWLFAEDPEKATDLRFCDADCPSKEYLGVDRSTPATKEIMVDLHKIADTLRDKPHEKDIVLNFYLVVRDKADDSSSIEDTRFGMDFTTMKLVLKRP